MPPEGNQFNLFTVVTSLRTVGKYLKGDARLQLVCFFISLNNYIEIVLFLYYRICGSHIPSMNELIKFDIQMRNIGETETTHGRYRSSLKQETCLMSADFCL